MKLILTMLLAGATAFAQSAPRIYVVNKAANSVSVINPQSLRVEHTIPVGTNPHEVAVTPDGQKLYVPNMGGNTVSVIDLRSNSKTKDINHADFSSPHGVAFTPDSRRALSFIAVPSRERNLLLAAWVRAL